MISAWGLYWLIKLDSIISLICIFSAFCLLGVILVGLFAFAYWIDELEKVKWEQYCCTRDEKKEYMNKAYEMIKTKHFVWIKRLSVLFIIFVFLGKMLPTTKEMSAILVLPKIANGEFINQTFPKEMNELYTIAKDWLKDKARDSVKK